MSYATKNCIADAVQLVPFEIWSVMLDDKTIRFFEPLIIKPRILDRGTPAECFCAECAELDLFAVGVDLDELLSCLRSDIRMTWKRVVQKHTNALTADERRVKQRWLNIAEVINDGGGSDG